MSAKELALMISVSSVSNKKILPNLHFIIIKALICCCLTEAFYLIIATNKTYLYLFKFYQSLRDLILIHLPITKLVYLTSKSSYFK